MHQAAQRIRRALDARRWNQDYVDAILAAVLAIAVLWFAATHERLDLLAVILLLGQTVPLAYRRRSPPIVLLITGLSIGIYSGAGYQEVGGNLGVLIAFYTLAANRPRRHAAMAFVLCAGGVFLTLVNYAASSPVAMQELFNVYLEYVVAWLVGDYLRVRRLYVRELEERTQRAEREREERARLAVLEERSRIARELHDVVAHHVSVMVVQAGGAKRIVGNDPAAAKEALGAVEDAGRTALAEMRRMLEVLRAQQPGLAPQPGLAGLERLVNQVRTTGVPVTLEIEGEWRELPAGIDLAAYRIVQEALTNVVKHAGPKAEASVHIAFAATCLDIRVEDDGRGAVSQLHGESGGQGLIGMRERVELYGGQLEVGPILSGGFQVHARLPLPPPPKLVMRVLHPAYTPPAEPPAILGHVEETAGDSNDTRTTESPAAAATVGLAAGAAGGPATDAVTDGTLVTVGSPVPGAPLPEGEPDPNHPERRTMGGPVFSPWPEEARP